MKICPNCGTEYPDATTLCPSDGVALEKTGDSLLGQVLAGKYRMDERLNEGGMGAVYRGTHVLMDKTVAVKVLRPALAADEKIVARFSREARAASRISHPHAVSVTDFGESEEGVVFLVMEYLNGKTLKEIIREEGPMPLPRVVEILRQVGGALGAAHEQGVVHRDLKSENIMLLNSAGPDYAKVLDFGIAKITEPTGTYDPGLTAPDLVIGTPQYMSPEQCSQASEIDARSDLYSLGVIIFEMLVGHVPFTGPSPTAIMMKHLQDEAPSVLQERPDLPSGVGRVLQRAMAKHPDDRHQHVGDLVEDLTVASGMEVAAVPPVPTSSASHRIVVPTHSTSERAATEPDEETMLRPRVENMSVANVAPRTTEMYAASPASNLNLWKILIPSLAGLLLVFAVVYAFTKNSEPANNNQPQPGLVADPNSQAVEAAPPATGKTEQDIPSVGRTANEVTNANENENANANAEATLSPIVTVNSNANSTAADENSNQNTNKPPTTSVPLPSPSNRVNTNEQPPIPPPGNKPAPQPSAKPPDASAPPP
ncbi:MAG: serine/threonine protein kinase [Pyrinomonadaceae bacterium]|nr:serine/threonine protein kinase [Pyrinomonadaceae bacterium]